MKLIAANLSSLKETRVHEYVLRFCFGGICTVVTGLVARHFGPEIGGLFLAFPAIYPAGVSLIESHEKRRKKESGFDGTNRGRVAASVDSAGASIGCVGLIAFAMVVAAGIQRIRPGLAIMAASLSWFGISWMLWILRKRGVFFRSTGRLGVHRSPWR
jgi:hypothetical protein